jgi:hypothetical protein
MFQALFVRISDGLVEDFGDIMKVLDHHGDGLIVE